MSYHGPQGRGAARRHRIRKREEAEARNALTPPERRKANRGESVDAAMKRAALVAGQ